MSIRRDTLYNLSGQLIPVVVTLVTLPTFLGLIGESRYGVMALAWVLLGYFGLFDFGMSPATAQRVAQMDRASPTERSDVLWTALIAITALGSIGGLLLWGVGQFMFTRLVPLGEVLQAELHSAFPWLCLGLPVTLSASALAGALQGRRQFLSLNVVGVMVSSLALILPLAVAAAGHITLEWLVPATLVPRALGMILLFGLCHRHVPLSRPIAFDARRLRSLLSYGGWITVAGVVGPLLSVADRLIIAKVFGPSAVTFYTIPQGLVSRGFVFAGSLAGAIFPRFAAQTVPERDALIRSVLRVLVFTMTPVAFIAIWLVDPFFIVWLGPDIASQSVPVAEILLLGLWLNSLTYVTSARLQGEGNPRIVALVLLSQLIPYALLLWMLLLAWGIVGAAVAWTIRVGVSGFVMLALSGAGITTYAYLLIPFGIVASSMSLALILPRESTLRWELCAFLFVVMAFWAVREVPHSFGAVRRDQSRPARFR